MLKLRKTRRTFAMAAAVALAAGATLAAGGAAIASDSGSVPHATSGGWCTGVQSMDTNQVDADLVVGGIACEHVD